MKIKEPSILLREISKKFNKNDLFAVITVFILGMINNFCFITNEGVSPDALSMSYFNFAGNWEIMLGRFGIKFVDMMRFGLVNKFIIILICLLFLSLSTIIIIKTFKIKNKILIFLLSTLIAVAPQFTETYMFIYCADAYCLAFLLATLAVFFLEKAKNKKIYYVLSCICTIIVCSLYQAYLGVLIGETIILLIYQLLNNKEIKEILIKFFKYMLTIFIGILLYYITLKIIISTMDISLASYKGANSLGINTILSLPNTILQTYKDFFKFFFTNEIINNSYYKRIKINAIIFAISFIGLIFILIKNEYNKKGIRILLLSLLIAIYPIGIAIMNIIAPTTTINLVTGPGLITTIILVILIYKKLNDSVFENLIKYVLIITMLILMLTFILENTYTYMDRQQTYINYYTISNDIYSKVVELDEYSNDKKWMFSDVIRFYASDREKTNGFISNDNETWDNYNGTTQNISYFEKYLGIKINICSKEEYDEIVKTESFKDMPIYPNKGSIKIINDVIVIKISDKTF